MCIATIVVVLSLCVRGFAQCPVGFMLHDDSCYHFSHDQETWADALVLCDKVYGAYLTEIFDEREMNFLGNEVRLMKANFWTGATDLRIEGEWVWATSKKDVNYTKWSPGGPSNSGGNENCLEIMGGNGFWNDKACGNQQHYICEKNTEAVEVIGK